MDTEDGTTRRSSAAMAMLPSSTTLQKTSSWCRLGRLTRTPLLWLDRTVTELMGTVMPEHAYRGLRSRKNAWSSAADSSARTPPVTSGRWLSRRSRTTSHRDPAAPALGSSAP